MENKLIRNHHNHKCIPNSYPSSNSLAMHKDSHRISKTKPKIRIIHIFAPEIIKTDAENFRELVQKLTGKPSGEKKYFKKKKKPSTKESRSITCSSDISEDSPSMRNGGVLGLDLTVKEEVRGDESMSGGYLGGFSDLEGFISEIGGFPLLPLDATHIFQDSQLLYNRTDA